MPADKKGQIVSQTSTEERGGLPSAVNAALTAIPEGARVRFAKFLIKVIGQTLAPEAVRKLADEMDTLSGRRIVAHKMAEAVAERLAQDRLEVERAIYRFWDREIPRQKNLQNIACKAAEEFALIADQSPPVDDVPDDWRRKFMDYAADVSEPEMQQVWARILTGEYRQPGSFSFRTLRLMSEMSAAVAEAFQRSVRFAFNSETLFAPTEVFSSGQGYSDINLICDRGMTYERADKTVLPVRRREPGYYVVMGEAHAAVLFSRTGTVELNLPIIQLTNSGKELLPLVGARDERPALQEVANYMRRKLPTASVGMIGPVHSRADESIVIDRAEFLWGSALDLP
jgi:Protein of unknown function (DUF2806).